MTSPLALALLLAGSTGEHPATPTVAIKWEKKFDDALREAKRSGRPIVVDFWAEWCGWCHRLERTTYADPTVIQRAQGFVAVRVNTEGSRRELEVCAKYGVGERLPPLRREEQDHRQPLAAGAAAVPRRGIPGTGPVPAHPRPRPPAGSARHGLGGGDRRLAQRIGLAAGARAPHAQPGLLPRGDRALAPRGRQRPGRHDRRAP